MAGHLQALYNKMREHMSRQCEDGETEPTVKCTYCTRKVRLLSFLHLKPGDHISMGGENFKRNIGKRQVSVYSHHAIVKAVDNAVDASAMVTMVQFISTPFDPDLKIRETTEVKNLEYDEIYVIKYRHKTHPADIIIKRAEQLANEDATYKLLTCNCEHFCHWCCVGNETSCQVKGIWDTVKNVAAGAGHIGGKILKTVTKLFFLSLDDLSKVATSNFVKYVAVPWGVLSVMALIYLIYCIVKHDELNQKLNKGEICRNCCRREKQDLWMKFVIYCGLQVGGIGLLSLVVAATASAAVTGGLIAVVGVLSLVIMWGIPRLKAKLCSPFEGRLVKVRTLRKIWIGDVLSFDHWKLSHDGVVSAVKIRPHTRNQKGTIKLIHYSKPTIFGKRVIVEEDVAVDLEKDLIRGHDYSNYDTHEPEIVVERARKRIGETKHGLFSNRSCHFCHWAKLHEDDIDELDIVPTEEPVLQFDRSISPLDSLSAYKVPVALDQRRSRKHATKTLGKTWAKIRDELKEGQIVSFKFEGLWHKAVTTAVEFDRSSLSKVHLTVVHYGSRKTVTEDQLSFDLNREDIWIDKYHPLSRFSKADVIRRARDRVGEQKFNAFSRRSSHLAEEIVEKHKDTLVRDMDEAKPGDAITFYHWSLKHDGIVTKVRKSDSKENNKGTFTVIHYALETLFGTRTIKEDTMAVDLRKDTVYLKNFSSYVTYPRDRVVKRAKSRIGEQRFSTNGNTSWDLVHWAKVVQKPAIARALSGEKHLMMPKTDEPYMMFKTKSYNDFQIHRAHSWAELQPGTIVEYRYYWLWHHGIVSESDETANELSVIHYGTPGIFAARTVMEDTLRVNLKRDDLWVYTADPTKCHKPPVVVKRARMRLGEQEWRSGNRSWDFCKQCLMKRITRSLERAQN